MQAILASHMPVFPSVYSPADKAPFDGAYYQAIHRLVKVEPGQEVLVVGPGAGADAST